MTRSDSVETRVRLAWADFFVLNDVSSPYFLIDFTPSKSNILWVNEAGCRLLGMPLEKLQGLNLNGGNSAATQLEFTLIHKAVQLEGGNLDKERAVFPGGKKFHYLWRCQPCLTLLPGKEVPEVLSLVMWAPLDNKYEHSSAEQLPLKVVSTFYAVVAFDQFLALTQGVLATRLPRRSCDTCLRFLLSMTWSMYAISFCTRAILVSDRLFRGYRRIFLRCSCA